MTDKDSSRLKLLLSLFSVFFKIGAFTWGGGYAMLPLIKNEVVEKKRWISSDDFIDGIAVSQSLPGAIAVNTATFVGHKICGKLGSLVATAGAVLPSVITIIIVAMFFLQFKDLKVVQSFFRGANPAIAALILSSVLDLGKSALKNRQDIIISIGLLLLLIYFDIHPILAIIISAILGIILKR
ncbi:MAG TPA: chromate transporter [bacterium]|jgi:chromate transporter|nr:chromate transporter [Dictyoglomota bacterium]HHV80065.1 chromate transporter [bacterium]HRR92325.1 chromate transporter [bacterium]